MKIKLFFKISCAALVFFSLINSASASIFPVKTVFKSGQDCSVASDDTPAFCQPSGAGSFEAAVQSCCPLGKLPMQQIYNLMIGTYGTLQNACVKNAEQYGGTVQACIDQWNCYWLGGKDSEGNLCDGNGQPCGTL